MALGAAGRPGLWGNLFTNTYVIGQLLNNLYPFDNAVLRVGKKI